jgi:hypothetical protein
MNQRILHIIIGLLVVLTTTAQPQFRTSELRRLATVLSIDTSQLTEGYSHPMVKGLTLTVHQERQTIDHIGLQLFSPEMRSMGQSPIFDFLERYFLQLKYPPTVKSASNMLRDDEFRFLKGSLSSIDEICPTDDFAFNNDNHRYTATWNRDGQVLLSVSFPLSRERL